MPRDSGGGGGGGGTPYPGTNEVFALPNDPSRFSSTSFHMMGLGSALAITPKQTGNIRAIITADGGWTATTDGMNYQIAWGTGVAPSNGAAATGTVVGKTKALSIENANISEAFTIIAVITGLTLGTAIWIDLQVESQGGNLFYIKNVAADIQEI